MSRKHTVSGAENGEVLWGDAAAIVLDDTRITGVVDLDADGAGICVEGVLHELGDGLGQSGDCEGRAEAGLHV